MRTLASTILFVIASVSAVAQDAAPESSFWRDPLGDPLFPFYVVTGFVFLTAILVIMVAAYMLQILNMIIRKAAEEHADKLGIRYVPQPTWWSKFWMSVNAFKPMEEEKDVMLDHNYDGIRELDNHLPPWWKWLLYGTIVWGAVYMVVYHVTKTLPLMEGEYQAEVARADEQRSKRLAANPPLTIDEGTLVYEPDDAILQSGRKIYVTNCASCHLSDGQGSIGPNLTDDYWLHGGNIRDIYAVIKNGVPEKGMISWAPVLSQEQMRDVAFYIKSLHGSNPPNPKAPQGELYKEEEPAAQPGSEEASI
jgi:cytochrome c oxidase cbb3-type subunit 3